MCVCGVVRQSAMHRVQAARTHTWLQLHALKTLAFLVFHCLHGCLTLCCCCHGCNLCKHISISWHANSRLHGCKVDSVGGCQGAIQVKHNTLNGAWSIRCLCY